MSDDRYGQIFEDLTRDLFTVAQKHGKRAIREAVRAQMLHEEDDEQDSDGDVPPEELDYPDEDVWTIPPAADEEDKNDDEDTEEDELSEAAERVASELAEKLERRLRK